MQAALPAAEFTKSRVRSLGGIKADIKALRRTETYLTEVLADWEQKMRKAGPGHKAHLLHSLTRAMNNSDEVTNRFRRKNKS
jgi:hypothetical protein